MQATWQAAADILVADLRTIFGTRLRAVAAYGSNIDGSDMPLTCLAIVESLVLSDLEGCAGLAGKWERAHIAVPLVLPEEEFRRSFDAFPLEYSEILRTRQPLFGPDLFNQLTVPAEDLRRACERQVKSHLVHLRESYIEARQRPAAVAALVRESAPGFAALLRNLAQLAAVVSPDRAQSTREGAKLAGLSDAMVAALLAMETPGNLPSTDAARLFPDYLAAVEQLARTVDAWRGEPR